ncbi:MAG: hypothetical protein PHU21_02535, partial [Elusimicrobia bacterium]|nr:hypothetical protein [Elusimicrobiota bacterium]
RVLVRQTSRQGMSAGYDARRGERLFRLLRWVGNLYRVLLPAVFLIALVCYGRSLRRWGLLPALSTALLIALLTRLLLFSFIDAASWPAVNLLYLAPCYPLLILFCGTALLSSGTQYLTPEISIVSPNSDQGDEGSTTA